MMPLQRDSAILPKPMSAFNTPPFELIQTSTQRSWTCTPKGKIDLSPHVNKRVLVFWPYGLSTMRHTLPPGWRPLQGRLALLLLAPLGTHRSCMWTVTTPVRHTVG